MYKKGDRVRLINILPNSNFSDFSKQACVSKKILVVNRYESGSIYIINDESGEYNYRQVYVQKVKPKFIILSEDL